jgi:hypothetical protein
MNRTTLSLCVLSAFATGSINVAFTQDLPRTQPKILTIWREEVKVGQAEAHSKYEAGFVAAFEKAKSPDHYLTMTSMTGSPEAWYVIPQESYTAIAETMKREDKDPVLSAKLAKLVSGDAKYIHNARLLQAHARTDLSAGEFPDLARARFFAISVLRVRPGHEAQFEEAAKAFGAARMKVAPRHGFRIYQVVAGMPTPTFLIFSSVEKYGDFDETTAAFQATLKALTPQETEARQKFLSEGLISSEMNRFRLDPRQSYVSKETRATDPEFWSLK